MPLALPAQLNVTGGLVIDASVVVVVVVFSVVVSVVVVVIGLFVDVDWELV